MQTNVSEFQMRRFEAARTEGINYGFYPPKFPNALVKKPVREQVSQQRDSDSLLGCASSARSCAFKYT